MADAPVGCIVCGAPAGDGVQVGLIKYRTGEPFGAGPHCLDRVDCHDRVWAAGAEWELDDDQLARPAPVDPPPAAPAIAPATEANTWFD